MLQPIQCTGTTFAEAEHDKRLAFTEREHRLLERAAAAQVEEEEARHKRGDTAAPLPPGVPAVAPVLPAVPVVVPHSSTLKHIRREFAQKNVELVVVSSSFGGHTNAVHWTTLRRYSRMSHILSRLRENAAAAEEPEPAEDLDDKEDAHSHRPVKPRYLLDLDADDTSKGLGSNVILLGGGKVVQLRATASEQQTASGSAQTALVACKQKVGLFSSSSSSDEDDAAQLQAARRRRKARAQKSRP